MKKYTLYAWIADDESGVDICFSEEFSPSLGYRPESGWRARPSKKIGEFDTVSELADLLIADAPLYYKDDKNLAINEAAEMLNWFNCECEDEY